MTNNLDGFTRVELGDIAFAAALQRRGWATGKNAYRFVGGWCEFFNTHGAVVGKAKYDNAACTALKYIKG